MINKVNIELFSNDFSLEKIKKFVIDLKGKVIFNEIEMQNFVFQNKNVSIFCYYLEKDKVLCMEIGGFSDCESSIYVKDILKKIIENFSDIIFFSSLPILFDYYYLQKKKYLFDYAFSLDPSNAIIGLFLKSKEHCKNIIEECSKCMIIDNNFCADLIESFGNKRGDVFKKVKHYNFNGFYLQMNIEEFNEFNLLKFDELILKYSIDQISISINYKIQKEDYDIILNGSIFSCTR